MGKKMPYNCCGFVTKHYPVRAYQAGASLHRVFYAGTSEEVLACADSSI